MLLNAFILMAVMMLMMNGLYESTILQIKMSGYFKQHREASVAEDIQLRQSVTMLEEGECNPLSCEYIQFIPDAYFQYETQGVQYYRFKGNCNTTVAIRQSMPQDVWVPTTSLKDLTWYESCQIPIIGDAPDNRGFLFYLTITSEDGQYTVIEAWQRHSKAPPTWIFTIDENTRLSVPTLWHGRLIVDAPEKNKIVVYDAFTGEKIQEANTSVMLVDEKNPACTLTPTVLVRSAAEYKRKVIVNRDFMFWSAEIDVDYDRLGMRSWNGKGGKSSVTV